MEFMFFRAFLMSLSTSCTLLSHHFTHFAALGQHKQVWVEVARAALWRESTTVMNVVSTYIISMYMIRGISGQELSSCRKAFAHLL